MSNEIKVKIEKTDVYANPVAMKTYNSLVGKPKINGVELVGDKTTADLGIEVDTSKFATKDDLADKADKSEIPDVSGFATKEDISEFATQDDLSEFVTREEYQTTTAYFRGNWATWADVPSDPELYPADVHGNHAPTANDYMVIVADERKNGGTWRYKYTGLWSEQGKSGWQAEYQVNETPLTAAQLAALNSGVTAQAVASIANKQDKLTAGDGITIEGNTISASGGASGDYLPLAGGEMSGPIAFSGTDYSIKYDASKYGLAIYTNASRRFIFSNSGYGTFFSTSDKADIGQSSNKWRRVYAKIINNGADLAVPTVGGTLARLEDITASVGDISTALTAILGE